MFRIPFKATEGMSVEKRKKHQNEALVLMFRASSPGNCLDPKNIRGTPYTLPYDKLSLYASHTIRMYPFAAEGLMFMTCCSFFGRAGSGSGAAEQSRAEQSNAMQSNAVQCNAMQCNAMMQPSFSRHSWFFGSSFCLSSVRPFYAARARERAGVGMQQHLTTTCDLLLYPDPTRTDPVRPTSKSHTAQQEEEGRQAGTSRRPLPCMMACRSASSKG
jgi:hypothetical protein